MPDAVRPLLPVCVRGGAGAVRCVLVDEREWGVRRVFELSFADAYLIGLFQIASQRVVCPKRKILCQVTVIGDE